MNLKVQLLYRILIIAIICLMTSAYYVLYQTDKLAKSEANFTAQLIAKQVRKQLLTMFSHNDFSSPFPNTKLWPEINGLSGSCIQFVSRSEHRRRNLCNQTIESKQAWPNWFDIIYQQFFSPNFEVKKNISFNAISYGSVLVSLNSRIETARAWNNFHAIIGVLFASIFAVCILVYVTINRLLKPAQLIITGLDKMRDGRLDTRLPSFNIKEWKQTSDAINQLASSQEQVFADNKQLALKLMNIQEEDHRYIARELHDEFGQYLAGINAVTTSIHQTAQTQCPELVPEIKSIKPITNHMMEILHSMLNRLRPIEIDDLGLSQSLNNLVANWNNRSNGQTDYQLKLKGNIDHLAEPLPINIYRIVQECLSNIAKHAKASHSEVFIDYQIQKGIYIEIKDDGVAKVDDFDNTLGVGLLGIRERVMALGGQISLLANKDNGLTISITLPDLV